VLVRKVIEWNARKMISETANDGRARVLFSYWGRRGAGAQFTLEIARASCSNSNLPAAISIARQNELFRHFNEFSDRLLVVDTFGSGWGAVLQSWRIAVARRRLAAYIKQHRIVAVIEIMPHVWSPFVMPVVQAAGARYITIVHDAVAHPGDHTGWAKALLDRPMQRADRVVTMSAAVARRVEASGLVPASKIATVLHPDFSYGVTVGRRAPAAGEPFRLAFLGRIMDYKGLPLFVDAMEQLRAEGAAIEGGVYGEGALGVVEPRLQPLKIDVVNRWLSEAEIADILARAHAVVVSHTEASQSGIVAMALGAGLPVVATPVGGLVEQVADGVTGIIAKNTSAFAVADAIRRLIGEAGLYDELCQNIAKSSEQRSMARFVDEVTALAIAR
jgi:glycosyltransferase involved in cell wall biosynthesis